MKSRKDRIRTEAINEHGDKLCVVERADGSTEEGVLSTAKHGESIPEGADYIKVDDCGHDCGGWHDMETIYSNRGPSQVATKAYRSGYERIFGGKQKIGEA